MEKLRERIHLILIQLIKDYNADNVEGYGSKAVDQILALVKEAGYISPEEEITFLEQVLHMPFFEFCLQVKERKERLKEREL